jgi:D-threonate/D-erythronate kinase
MSASVVIIADDLTGAADCGIVCTAAGLNTVVVLGEISRALELGADAIAFDADTRRQCLWHSANAGALSRSATSFS